MSIIHGKDWERVSEHLDRVLEMPEGERDAYVEELARSDPQTGSSLARLLSAHRAQAYAGFLSGSSPLFAEFASGSQLIGKRIGAYVIEAEIGRGGMGSVWRAHRADGRFEGVVAVKFLRAAWLGSAGEQRFKLEGLVLARLDHPNIARLLDAGLFEGQPYLILEFVEGESIDSYCSRQQLDLQARVRLFLDVLAAVSHAHTHLIVHRDIKPGNILVTRDGTPKLLDFGIAKLLQNEAGSDLTLASAQPLTPQYAAPEQLLGEPVTTATDVYALGLVLYTLLTGAHPRASQSLKGQDLLRDVLNKELPRPSATTSAPADARALEGDLDNIIAKALKNEAAERYSTAAALAGDLEHHLRHEPVTARPDTLQYRAAKFVRRNRGSVMTALAIAIALIATTSFALVQTAEVRRQRDAARSELLLAEAANDFSSLMLEEMDVGGKPLNRGQLLDRGLELLDARHGADPEFVAEMLTQLAGRYNDDGRNAKSLELAQRAVSIARTTHNPGLLALTLCTAAYKEHDNGKQIDPDGLQEAAAIVASLPEPPLHTSTDCLRARAWQASDNKDPKTAAALLEQARALLVDAGVRSGPNYTSALNDLGYVYYNQGRYADAYAVTAETGAAFDRGGRGGTLGRVIIHENAATLLLKMGEVRSAYTELDAAQHPLPGEPAREPEPASRPVYSEVLRRLGRFEEARATVSGRAEGFLASGAPIFASRDFMEEGAALMELNRSDQARSLLERGIEVDTQYESGGGSMRFLSESNSYLADLDVREGHADAARQRLEKFLASQGYPRTPATPLRPAILSAARAALAARDFQAAEKYAREALRIAESVSRGPDTSADVGESLLVLARIARAQNHPTEIRPLLDRALRCVTASVGPEAPLTAQVREELARS
ncbi:MAG TPA: serine/threonine-protein kinase [Steroidobacteraceae bacterium]|jgi:serine/threonine-protein kinase